MLSRISEIELVNDLKGLGLQRGDTVLVRASMGAIGKISGGAETFIDAILNVVGEDGTLVSLAFTDAAFFKKPKIENSFDLKKKSYAGALPNSMLLHSGGLRSAHPTCSYVAIGRMAEEIIKGHDEFSSAYEPIRKIIELNGKCVLIGCVDTSPGFTTAHLAEADLGMLKRLPIFSRFTSTYYKKSDGTHGLFRRTDPGLCSNSFYKFYALYVRHGILKTGFVGNAYSILVPAKEAYDIEYSILQHNEKFNICDSKYCFTCNANRWDRLLYMPGFVFRKIHQRFFWK